MVAIIGLLVVMFGILGFRIYRTVQYYNEAHNTPDPEERRIARTNFVIHFVFCVLLSIIITAVIYWLVLASVGEV
jgi:hypothetical protein